MQVDDVGLTQLANQVVAGFAAIIAEQFKTGWKRGFIRSKIALDCLSAKAATESRRKIIEEFDFGNRCFTALAFEDEHS